VHYLHGPHWSPWPQYPASPPPSTLAQSAAFWVAHAVGRSQCALGTHGSRSPPRRVSSARGVARGSTTQQRVIGDEVFGTSIHTTPATNRYTHTSMVTTEEGFSPGQRAAQRQSGQTASNSDESSQARFLSCTSMPRVLEARRRSFPTMRSDTKSSHWQRAGVTRVIPDGRRRSGPMVVKPGAKQLQGVGD
jgi:hypothetical protein